MTDDINPLVKQCNNPKTEFCFLPRYFTKENKSYDLSVEYSIFNPFENKIKIYKKITNFKIKNHTDFYIIIKELKKYYKKGELLLIDASLYFIFYIEQFNLIQSI